MRDNQNHTMLLLLLHISIRLPNPSILSFARQFRGTLSAFPPKVRYSPSGTNNSTCQAYLPKCCTIPVIPQINLVHAIQTISDATLQSRCFNEQSMDATNSRQKSLQKSIYRRSYSSKCYATYYKPNSKMALRVFDNNINFVTNSNTAICSKAQSAKRWDLVIYKQNVFAMLLVRNQYGVDCQESCKSTPSLQMDITHSSLRNSPS